MMHGMVEGIRVGFAWGITAWGIGTETPSLHFFFCDSTLTAQEAWV